MNSNFVDFLERLSGLIVAVIGLFGTIIALIFGRRKEAADISRTLAESRLSDAQSRKTDAEVTSGVVSNAVVLIDQLQEEVRALRADTDSQRLLRESEAKTWRIEIDTLKLHSDGQDRTIAQLKKENTLKGKRIAELEHGVSVLVEQIRKQGLTPAWEPNGE